MLATIFFLATLVFVFSIFLSIVVGLFVGVVYLIMYFMPIVDIADTLLPAAILTTVPIIMVSNVFKELISETLNKSDLYYDYDSDSSDD